MLKIIIAITFLAAVGIGLFFWFKNPNLKAENPFIQSVGKILGFTKETTTDSKSDNLLNQTKETVEENTQKNLETIKETVYNEARTSLDNVFNKQATSNNDAVASINVLGVITNPDINEGSITIDLSQNNDLNLNLSLNKKYYLKFQNIPQNYCLYINNGKYPLTDGTLEIQFTTAGNYPLIANSCDLNEKNIGTLVVQ